MQFEKAMNTLRRHKPMRRGQWPIGWVEMEPTHPPVMLFCETSTRKRLWTPTQTDILAADWEAL